MENHESLIKPPNYLMLLGNLTFVLFYNNFRLLLNQAKLLAHYLNINLFNKYIQDLLTHLNDLYLQITTYNLLPL